MEGGQRTLAHERYDTVVHVGVRDGRPMLTITTSARATTPAAPTPPYVWSIASGLREAHGWRPSQIASYLTVLTGMAGHWTADDVVALTSKSARSIAKT
jgi:hypothetical protein